MKPFKDFDKAKEEARMTGLPGGGYELIIKGTAGFMFFDDGRGQKRVIQCRPEEQPDYLEIYVDVNAGEHQYHFSRDYKAQTGEDKRWRGVYKLYIPKDDGSDKDAWTKKSFARAINAIEDSNPGYHWDWNEARLKDKVVGGLFNFRQYTKQDGSLGMALNLASLIDIAKIKSGDYKVPADKLLPGIQQAKDAGASVGMGFMAIPDSADDEGLPFN